MKTISLLLSQPWVRQLGWTLIQFLWQGTMISILFAVSRRLLGRTLSAQARYLFACGTLAAMTAAPVLTFFLMPRLTKGVPPLISWPCHHPTHGSRFFHGSSLYGWAESSLSRLD